MTVAELLARLEFRRDEMRSAGPASPPASPQLPTHSSSACGNAARRDWWSASARAVTLCRVESWRGRGAGGEA